MQKKWMAVSAGALLIAGGGWLLAHKRAGAAPPDEAQAMRRSVELTIYKEDFGMVHEVRPQQLGKGSNRLHVLEVSKLMDPQSVSLHWQGSGSLPALVAQAYDLGVANGDSLLKRYLGRKVEVVRYGENGHEAERQEGTLMVEGNGEVVLQSEGKFYVHPPGAIVAPTDRDIVTIPQLSVQAESPAAQAASLDVAYLTRGMAWSGDYVATLSPKEDTLALECWATVTNRTGVDYPNARVTLIAGTPNRAVVQAQSRSQAVSASASEGGRGSHPLFADGSFGGRYSFKGREMEGVPTTVGDFHAYTIKSTATIVQEQMNRLLLLSSDRVPVIKDYSTRPPVLSSWDDLYNWGPPSRSRRGTVAVALTFANGEKEGLGVPLPQGAIRLYEPDATGALRYAGAASLEDTPKEAKVNLTIARAFDVYTEWRLAKRQQVNKHTVRKTVELTLHNEKQTPVNLRVVQSFSGRWKIVAEPIKHANPDAGLAQWVVNVPAGGKALFRYVVDLVD
jgi:hypothetical protein